MTFPFVNLRFIEFIVYVGESSVCTFEQYVLSCLEAEHSMICKLGQVGDKCF